MKLIATGQALFDVHLFVCTCVHAFVCSCIMYMCSMYKCDVLVDCMNVFCFAAIALGAECSLLIVR